jgi:peptidoglycan/xylan/chitin deacetylase (PgdA/CDA1 family)
MGKNTQEIKYRIFWLIGIALSFILYFSGICGCYIFFRKKILKRYRTIILTYHRVRNDGKDPDISVSTVKFEREMAYLKRHFNVISLGTLINDIGKSPNILVDNIAITFDDGYKDNYLNAYPVLKRHGLSATIFLVSKLVGTSEGMLNEDEIEMMRKGGIDFGSHTASHKVLTEIDINTAAEEILRSKEDLGKLLKEEMQFFAYPRGKRKHFNNKIKYLVKKSGYKAAFTTENGEIDNRSDLFALKRIGIRNCPLFVFKVRVSGIFESRPISFLRNVSGLS